MQTRQNHWKIMELDEKKLRVEFSGVLLMGLSHRQCRSMIWDCVCVCVCNMSLYGEPTQQQMNVFLHFQFFLELYSCFLFIP